MMEPVIVTPYLLFYSALLEFRRCGMDRVRLNLFFNCLHEGTVKILADPEQKKLWKDEHFYRMEPGYGGPDEYWMPAIGQNLYWQFKVKIRDFRHLDLTDEEAVSFHKIQLIMMQQDKVWLYPGISLSYFAHPFYALLCSSIKEQVAKEGELELAYRRDMKVAKEEIRRKQHGEH